MPEKMGNTFKKTSMVTPLTADPGKADPGPPVMNTPIVKPNDPLGFMPKNGKTSK